MHRHAPRHRHTAAVRCPASKKDAVTVEPHVVKFPCLSDDTEEHYLPHGSEAFFAWVSMGSFKSASPRQLSGDPPPQRRIRREWRINTERTLCPLSRCFHLLPRACTSN